MRKIEAAVRVGSITVGILLMLGIVGSVDAQAAFLDQIIRGQLGSNITNNTFSNLGSIFNGNSNAPLLKTAGTTTGLTGIADKLRTSLTNITTKPLLSTTAGTTNNAGRTALPLLVGRTATTQENTGVLGLGSGLTNIRTRLGLGTSTAPTDPTNGNSGVGNNSNLLMYGMLGGMLGGSLLNSSRQRNMSSVESEVAAAEQALYGSSSSSTAGTYYGGYSPYSGMGMMYPMMMYPMMGYGGSGSNNQYGNMMGTMMGTMMLSQLLQQRQQTQSIENSLEQRVARMEQTMYEETRGSTQNSGILSGILSTGSDNLETRVNALQEDIKNCGDDLDNLESRQRAVEIKIKETSASSSSSSQGLENRLDNLEQRVDQAAITLDVQSTFTQGDGIEGRIDTLSARIARNEAAADNYEVELAAFSLADVTVETEQHSFSYVSQTGARTNLNITMWYPAGNGLVDPAQAPYPLVVFAHPCFDNLILQNAQQSSYIAEGLAKQGYIVCATTGNRNNAVAAGIYSDNSFDVKAIINEMLRLNNTANSIFLGTIDEENIGIVGYSLAGRAAEAVCGAGQEDYTDERVKAVVLLAPVSSISAQEARGIHIPAMFILGADDTKASVNSNKVVYDNIQAAKYMAVVKGTGHLDFTDLGKAKPAAETIVVYTTALFDSYLKVNVNAEETLQKKHALFLSYSYVLTGAEE